MYKVLVVDDEPMMLDGWRTMVDWQACGYELCGTATDGSEALAMIVDSEPDLVVTDIQMPVLDGLGLIRKMKALGLSSKTVIMSGYSEFAYAQQALHCQVDRYLLKPLLPDEIHALLNEMSASLKSRKLAEQTAEETHATVASSAISGLLRYNDAEKVESLRKLTGATDQICCRLIVIESLTVDNHGKEDSPLTAVRARLHSMIEDLRAHGMKAWLFEELHGRAGMLIFEEGTTGASFEGLLAELALNQRKKDKELALYCSAGAIGLASVPELYRQTMEVRDRVFSSECSGIHYYRENKSGIPRESRLEEVTTCTSALLNCMESGDAEGIRRSLDEIFRLLVRTRYQEGWGRVAIQHIRGELLRFYEATESVQPDESDWLRLQLCERKSSESFYRTREAMKLLCLRLSERSAERRKQVPSHGRVVAEATAYLNSHYREKIRLQALAERYHLTPVYFGLQFKRETGMSVHDYIHRLRIEEAKKLLLRTDMLVSDIAQTLGYHDAECFSRKFKSLTGERPSSYKNKW